MKLSMLVLLGLITGCAMQPVTDEGAAECVTLTFAYRNITRDARGPVRVTLDDQTDDYRDLGVYEVTSGGLQPLGRFRVWRDRRIEFYNPVVGIYEPTGYCDK